MQASQTPVILTVIVCTLAIGFMIFLAVPEIPEVSIPNASEIVAAANIPTAAEIAAAINVPPTRLSLKQELKADALDVCDVEFDMDDVEDLFDDDDEVTLVKEYVDKREYNNIHLGIDDADDREITIERVYKVEVEPDLDDDYKDKVYVKCEVTSDDGELEADLDYNL